MRQSFTLAARSSTLLFTQRFTPKVPGRNFAHTALERTLYLRLAPEERAVLIVNAKKDGAAATIEALESIENTLHDSEKTSIDKWQNTWKWREDEKLRREREEDDYYRRCYGASGGDHWGGDR